MNPSINHLFSPYLQLCFVTSFVSGFMSSALANDVDSSISRDVDCEAFEVSQEVHSCKNFTLFSNKDQTYWLVNGQLHRSEGRAIDFDPREAGTYHITAGYETESCPQGITRELVIEVEESCFPVENSCEALEVSLEAHSCRNFTLSSDQDRTYWRINGEPYRSEGQSVDFDPREAGTYHVTAGYESEHCPQDVTRELIIEVSERCAPVEDRCEALEVSLEAHSCRNFTLSSNQDRTYWRVNGEPYRSERRAVDFDPREAGTYRVTVGYESEHCPQDVTRELLIEVNESCIH